MTIPRSSEGDTLPDGLPDGETDVYDTDTDEESTPTPDKNNLYEEANRTSHHYDPSWKYSAIRRKGDVV